jgi:hypothetical protein
LISEFTTVFVKATAYAMLITKSIVFTTTIALATMLMISRLRIFAMSLVPIHAFSNGSFSILMTIALLSHFNSILERKRKPTKDWKQPGIQLNST